MISIAVVGEGKRVETMRCSPGDRDRDPDIEVDLDLDI